MEEQFCQKFNKSQVAEKLEKLVQSVSVFEQCQIGYSNWFYDL